MLNKYDEDRETAILGGNDTENKMEEECQNISNWMPILLNRNEVSNSLKAISNQAKTDKVETRKGEMAHSILSKWYIHRIIEKSALTLFPLSYVVFNAWYWMTYFHKQEDILD